MPLEPVLNCFLIINARGSKIRKPMMANIKGTPVVVPRVLEGTLLNSWDIAKSLLAIMLLPLALALSIKASFPRIAARLQPYAARLPSISGKHQGY
jgi:hypothetical protein